MSAMRPSFLSVIAVGVLCLIAAGGCKKSLDTQAVGRWDGKLTYAADQQDDPMVKATAGITFALEILPDKTFKMVIATSPIEGSWDIAGDKINLHAKKFNGKSKDEVIKNAKAMLGKNFHEQDMEKMDKPVVLSLSGDGKTLTADEKGVLSSQRGPDGKLAFVKQPDAAK